MEKIIMTNKKVLTLHLQPVILNSNSGQILWISSAINNSDDSEIGFLFIIFCNKASDNFDLPTSFQTVINI
jgi:hypothetical protein